MASTMRFDRWEDSTGALIAEGSAPRGIVTTTAGGTNGKGYWQTSSNFATSSTSLVDITGATMTFTATAGRLYRATVSAYVDGVSSGRFQMPLTDGSNVTKKTFQQQLNSSWARGTFAYSYIFTGSGTTTLKVRMSAVDAGTYSVGYNADGFSYTIEDIGPA